MAKTPQSKDEALEALDFIVNVLKEHERDLDKLISELGNVTEQMGSAGELATKVEKVEEKIGVLQKEVTSLIGYVSTAPKEASAQPPQTVAAPAAPAIVGLPMILQCKQWEDFITHAQGAQTLSYSYREDDKVFEANALRGNQVVTYSGALPKLSLVLKAFLSKQLGVDERCVVEGALSVG